MHTCCKWNLPCLSRGTFDHNMLLCCWSWSDPAQVTIEGWHVQCALYMSGSMQFYLLMHVLQPHRHHAPVLAGRFECQCHNLAASNLPAKPGAWCHQHSHMHTRSLCCLNQGHQLVNCESEFAAMQTLAAEGSSALDCCDVQMASFTLQTSDCKQGGITGRPSLQLVCGLIFRLVLPQPGCPIGLIQGSWAGAEAAVARKLGAAGAAPTPAWSTCTSPLTSLPWHGNTCHSSLY